MRSSYLTSRAISLHIAVVVTVPGCLALGWWQLRRALEGNGLSWAYTFEWPFFALYAIVMWWKLVNEQRPEHVPAPKRIRSERRRAAALEREATEAVELEAYNAYLAELRASDRQPGSAPAPSNGPA